jgi:hypothetical protein
MDDQGLIPGRSWKFFSLPLHPNWLHGPSSFLSTGYWGLFPWGMMLTTHLHVTLKLRMHGTIPPLSKMSSWHGAYLRPGMTMPLPYCPVLPPYLSVHFNRTTKRIFIFLEIFTLVWSQRHYTAIKAFLVSYQTHIKGPFFGVKEWIWPLYGAKTENAHVFTSTATIHTDGIVLSHRKKLHLYQFTIMSLNCRPYSPQSIIWYSHNCVSLIHRLPFVSIAPYSPQWSLHNPVQSLSLSLSLTHTHTHTHTKRTKELLEFKMSYW